MHWAIAKTFVDEMKLEMKQELRNNAISGAFDLLHDAKNLEFLTKLDSFDD